MNEQNDAVFTAPASWPVVRKRQENVRAVLGFLREVAGSSDFDVNQRQMARRGSHARGMGSCWRCVRDLTRYLRDLAAEEEGDGELDSPFMTRVNEVVGALEVARTTAAEKELMVQLLECLFDVPRFDTRQYEGLLDPGGLREVFVQNATFMAAVKAGFNSVRGWSNAQRAAAVTDPTAYYTGLQARLDVAAEEAVLEFCRPVMDQYALDEDVMRIITDLVGQLADTARTTTVDLRPADTDARAVTEDFLKSDHFFIVWKRVREIQGLLAFCDILRTELQAPDTRTLVERNQAWMQVKDKFAAAVRCIPEALTALRRMRGRPDSNAAQSQGTWLGKLQTLAGSVVRGERGPQHDAFIMRLVVLLFDVPEGFFYGRRAGAAVAVDEMHNSYTRVWDPGNIRHIFQNHESFMSIVREAAVANGLSVALL